VRIHFLLPLGRLHVKHAVQREIWVPTQHLLRDQGKPQKTLIELAGRRTFRMHLEREKKVSVILMLSGPRRNHACLRSRY
jgi:hypothetical protein